MRDSNARVDDRDGKGRRSSSTAQWQQDPPISSNRPHILLSSIQIKFKGWLLRLPAMRFVRDENRKPIFPHDEQLNQFVRRAKSQSGF
jgi:hypothetical protein